MKSTTFENGGQPTFGALTWAGTDAPSKGRSSQHHLSYFAGMDADETRAQTVLSGDRNLAGAGAVQGMTVQDGALVGFTSSMKQPKALIEGRDVHWDRSTHNFAGNIGLADGSVHQTSSQQLSAFFAASFQQLTNYKTRIVLPTP
ncbi:MAG: hypothetical protein FJ405_06695 [Verrucomicrobia bacterium]|nr:hypothetical protein [Verrucomicrobiota bacterium]